MTIDFPQFSTSFEISHVCSELLYPVKVGKGVGGNGK